MVEDVLTRHPEIEGHPPEELEIAELKIGKLKKPPGAKARLNNPRYSRA